MPYLMPKHKFAIFFSPKVAGTSLRQFLFQVENGFAFQSFEVFGQQHALARLAKNEMMSRFEKSGIDVSGWTRWAVVRDPVKRALSGYSNRVQHYKELSNKAAGKVLKEFGLPADPDIDTFFANFLAYRQVSGTMARHFGPQDRFLGRDITYFDQVYRFEDLKSLTADLNARFETKIDLPWLRSEGPKYTFDDLSDETKVNLLDAVSGQTRLYDWVPEYREPYAAWFDKLDARKANGVKSSVWTSPNRRAA